MMMGTHAVWYGVRNLHSALRDDNAPVIRPKASMADMDRASIWARVLLAFWAGWLLLVFTAGLDGTLSQFGLGGVLLFGGVAGILLVPMLLMPLQLAVGRLIQRWPVLGFARLRAWCDRQALALWAILALIAGLYTAVGVWDRVAARAWERLPPWHWGLDSTSLPGWGRWLSRPPPCCSRSACWAYCGICRRVGSAGFLKVRSQARLELPTGPELHRWSPPLSRVGRHTLDPRGRERCQPFIQASAAHPPVTRLHCFHLPTRSAGKSARRVNRQCRVAVSPRPESDRPSGAAAGSRSPRKASVLKGRCCDADRTTVPGSSSFDPLRSRVKTRCSRSGYGTGSGPAR